MDEYLDLDSLYHPTDDNREIKVSLENISNFSTYLLIYLMLSENLAESKFVMQQNNKI